MDKAGDHELSIHIDTTTSIVNFLHNGNSFRENLRHVFSFDILLYVLLPCNAEQVVVQIQELSACPYFMRNDVNARHGRYRNEP